MFPREARPLRTAVVGRDALVETLSGWGSDAGRSIDAQLVVPAAIGEGTFDDGGTDCVVIDAGVGGDGLLADVAELAAERPDLPVVVLVDGGDDRAVADVLAAGVTETIPRSVLATEPTVVAERVAAAVEREYLERSADELFENVADGLLVHDPETGEILDANQRFCEMNGYTREELLGATIGKVTAPGEAYSVEAAREHVQAARDSGSQLFEWRNRRKDGEGFPVEVHLQVVHVRGEEYVLASVREITERKRREREYEQIFDGVNDAIVIQDPETAEPLDANQTFLDRLGYDDVADIRERFDELSATDAGYTRNRAQELCRRVVETREPETVEWQQETKSGERRWIEAKVDVAEIRGEERVVSMQRDVTERKRREREFEQIFNGVNDIVNVYDPETGDLVQVNDTMCELTGNDRETLLEQGLDVASATDAGFTGDRAEQVIESVTAAGEARELEWQLETADGEWLWLDVKATPATINGEDRVLTISRDVTERRRTERRLEAIIDRIDEAILFLRAADLGTAQSAPDYVSSGYEDIWGQSLDAMQARHEAGFFETIHPDDRADYRESLDAILREVEAEDDDDRYSLEYRIERPDGTVRWVHSDYYPVRWGDEPARMVVVSRDVTDRKDRERRMASFGEATDDLATADTPADATRAAVDAATEALDLPAVGTFLYDEENGALRPEVFTDPLAAAVDVDAVAPGDGPLWGAFAAGTVVASDGDVPSAGFVGGAGDAGTELPGLVEWRGLALGNHGLLVVGSPDGPLDDDAVQAAHVLAATLEAALNHLHGRRRLEAQEEQLRTQTERAERLDRVARLAQRVEGAITEASAPREIERAVCERLGDTGPYELAWIGGVDVGVDRISARATVGAPNGYVADLGLTTADGGPDTHPAVRAWETDAVQVTDSVVGDGPAGGWRRRVLTEGYQSLCAVPLVYDGVTHGVLTVGADAPNAFGERERDVLEQLGVSIANALAAVERRRALESDETLELEFAGEGTDLPFALTARRAGCRVRHERTVARQDGTVNVYFRLEGELPDDAAAVADEMLPGETTVVTEADATTVVTVRTAEWFGSPLAEYGAVLREATATPERTTLTVELPEQADVRSFADRLRAVAPSLELVAKRHHRHRDRTPAELSDSLEGELTDRQLEAVQTALSAGYFEWPRDSDGGEVADRLGITQPTLNKHLRLAERKTFELLFDDGE